MLPFLNEVRMQSTIICRDCCWWGSPRQCKAALVPLCPNCGSYQLGQTVDDWQQAFAHRDARRTANLQSDPEWDALLEQHRLSFSVDNALLNAEHAFLLHYHDRLPDNYMPTGRAHLACIPSGKPMQSSSQSWVIDVLAWDPEYIPESLDVLRFVVWRQDEGHLDAEIIAHNPASCPGCLRAKSARWGQIDPMRILPPHHIRWSYAQPTNLDCR